MSSCKCIYTHVRIHVCECVWPGALVCAEVRLSCYSLDAVLVMWDRLASELGDHLSLLPQFWDCKHSLLFLPFKCEFWALDSGPLACRASTEPSLQALAPSLSQNFLQAHPLLPWLLLLRWTESTGLSTLYFMCSSYQTYTFRYTCWYLRYTALTLYTHYTQITLYTQRWTMQGSLTATRCNGSSDGSVDNVTHHFTNTKVTFLYLFVPSVAQTHAPLPLQIINVIN